MYSFVRVFIVYVLIHACIHPCNRSNLYSFIALFNSVNNACIYSFMNSFIALFIIGIQSTICKLCLFIHSFVRSLLI